MKLNSILLISVVMLTIASGCSQATPLPAGRLDRIPTNALKILPAADNNPPLSLSEEYETPIPLAGDVNTPGGEDSPFILPDGQTIYFFFTPDVSIPVEKQILDGVTGIYAASLSDDVSGNVARVMLQDQGKLAGDGCPFVLGEVMWFCTTREGYNGLHWFTAEGGMGNWHNWQPSDFDPSFKVGELHISSDGNTLYFASDRARGMGGLDIWISTKQAGLWQEPVNLEIVNTADNEGYPALNPAGDELWFTRNYGIWRSVKVNDQWQSPIQIFFPLAGEPSIDQEGNVYFVHHFYQDNTMLEVDIYVAYKKK